MEDIEIARNTKLKNINEIAKSVELDEEELELYGKYKAKILPQAMEKRTNKQTVHITLSKKDYVEPRTEDVIIKEEKNFWESLIEKIQNIF